MSTDGVKLPSPAADTSHIAALFAIERAGTLALLAALLFAGPRAADYLEKAPGRVASEWLLLGLSAAAAIVMRLSMPLWYRLLLRVRPAPGYIRQAWPQWIGSIWTPLLVLSVALGHRGWFAISLLLWIVGLLASHVAGVRLLRRLDCSSAPLTLPPHAVTLLNQSFEGAGRVRLDLSRPDIVAWTPSAGGRLIILGPTAIEKFTPEELTAVIAHELGHLRAHRGRSTLWWQALLLALGAAALLFVLRAEGLRDYLPPAALAVPAAFLAIALLETLAIPLAAARGRHEELAANAWAVDHLPAVGISVETFASVLRKLHELLGRPAEPPRWYRLLFGDYPSLDEALAHIPRGTEPVRS